MPTAFSEQERTRVRRLLLDAGRERFARHGLRRTNVADLARDAGIGKGTFYLFFDSKEALFMALMREVEGDIHQGLVAELDALRHDPPAMVRRFVDRLFDVLERHPVLSVMTDQEEFARLLRKVSPEDLAANEVRDAAFFAQVLTRWRGDGVVGEVDPRVLHGLARAVFALTLQRAFIGDEMFELVRAFLVESVANQLLEAS